MDPLHLPHNVSWPTALGIPAGVLGAAYGRATAPRGHLFEGAMQKAVPWYTAGTGAGVGLQLAEHAPTEYKLPAQIAAILAGGLGGHHVGRYLVGKPSWETKKEILRSVNKAVDSKLEEHEKQSEEQDKTLHEWATENPELAAIPASGLLAAGVTHDPANPLREKTRAGLTGLLAAAGAVGGGAIGRSVLPGNDMATWGGAGLGGLVSYLAARRALKKVFGSHEKSAAGPVLLGLQEVKGFSDRRNYRAKHTRLRQLMEKYPSDFYVDSQSGNIVGVTHRPTGFKVHAPMHVLPPGVKRTPAEQLAPSEVLDVSD